MKLLLLIIILCAPFKLTIAKHIRSKKRSSSKKQEKHSSLTNDLNGTDNLLAPIVDSSLINKRSGNYIDEEPPVLPSTSETHLVLPPESKIESMIDNYDLIMQRSFNYDSTSSSPAPLSKGVISSIPTPGCKDNASYQSPLGGHCGCSLFEATDCQKWDIFLTNIEISELMKNCPVACGTCGYVLTINMFLITSSPMLK
jgi:hypothetical protein